MTSHADTATPLDHLLDTNRRTLPRRQPRDIRPLYLLAGFLLACLVAWLIAATIQAVSQQATARACVAAGFDWRIDEGGQRECVASADRR